MKRGSTTYGKLGNTGMLGATVVQCYQLVRADGGCRLDFCKVLEDDFGNLGRSGGRCSIFLQPLLDSEPLRKLRGLPPSKLKDKVDGLPLLPGRHPRIGGTIGLALEEDLLVVVSGVGDELQQ